MKQLLPDDSAELLVTLIKLGEMHVLLGGSQSALVAYTRVAAIQQNTHGEASMEFASALCDVGTVLSLGGYHEMSLAKFRTAAEILKEFSGESSEYAEALQGVGDAHVGLGQFQEAAACHKEALDIQKSTCGETSVECASVFHSRGKASLQEGSVQAAIYLLKKAAEVLSQSSEVKVEKQRRPSSLLAMTYRKLGDADVARGALDDALAYYERCWRIQTKILGREASVLVATQRKIILVRQELGRRTDNSSKFGCV